MVVVNRRSPIALRSSPGESAIRGPSDLAEDWRLANALIREAEASGEAIIHADVVIDLHVERSGVFYEFRGPLKVVGRYKAAIRGTRRRKRYLGQDGLGNGADSRRRNHVEAAGWVGAGGIEFRVGRAGRCRELRATGAVRVARGGVIDGNQLAVGICCAAEISVSKGGGRHCAVEELALVIINSQKIAEEERLILPNRPANIGAIIVVDARGLRDGLEKRDSSQSAYAVVFIRGAMKLIRARLEDDVGYRSISPAQFRVVIAGGHIHSLDRFDGRNVDGEKTGALVVVQTFELEVVGEAGLAIDLGAEAVLGVEEGGMLAVPASGAGHEVEQALKVPVEPQRKILYLPFFNLSSGVGAVGLQNGYFRGHNDGLRRRAGLESKVYANVAIHQNVNAGSHGLLESLALNGHFILAGSEIGKTVIPAVIRRRGATDASLQLGNSDFCTSHHRATRIRHCSEQSRIDGLR